jgi:glycosyltransferase involved in cell wall biosynthesis
MRIALATWTARRVGGVEDYLALVIPALQEAGHVVSLWHEVDVPADREPICGQADVQCFNASQLGIDASIRALRSWQPDVLYVHGIRDIESERGVLDIAPSVFFVHTYTGTCISGSKAVARPSVMPCDRRFGPACMLHYFARGCGGSSPVTMWKLFTRESQRLELLSQYRRVLTHSHHMRDEMRAHGIDGDVVPYPVLRPVSAPTHDPRSWHLLFAGRMHYLKGGLLFLDALPYLAGQIPQSIHVTFAGDGPDKEMWQARARQLISGGDSGLTIEFTGWLPAQEMAALYGTVDLLVVPSAWPEPFGSVGPAAAAAGIPAAAFDVGGISEWLTDGVSGHLAPGQRPTAKGLAQAIARCLADPRHYEALKEGARIMSQRFTMQHHIPALLSALEQARR